MSIASQLTALEGNISDAYNMVAQRGGTVPVRKNMENLDDAIATIPSGGSFIGIPREVDANGVYRMPTQSLTFALPSGVTDVGARALSSAFYGCTSLTSVDLSSLTTMSGSYAISNAFYDCTSLTSVDLSSLTTVSGGNAFSYVFSGCTNLTSVDLSSLATVSSSYAFHYAFRGCASLTSVSFPALATITGNSVLQYAFGYCTSLASVSFPALTTSSFGSRTNQFNNMLSGCSGVTVHFPTAIQSTIGSWASVTGGFGGTNTTVLFDL